MFRRERSEESNGDEVVRLTTYRDVGGVGGSGDLHRKSHEGSEIGNVISVTAEDVRK